MIEFRVPMKAPSTPNLREHHMARARRVKAQRSAIQRRMPKWPGGPLLLVRLTRIASRLLDSDNVQGALKSVRDSVAAGLRIDDASPLVEWRYAQAKGEPEVVVQIYRPGEDPPVPTGATTKKRTAKKAAPKAAYTPPRAAPLNAAKEAEATFAPPTLSVDGSSFYYDSTEASED